jgi:hypothetical protein
MKYLDKGVCKHLIAACLMTKTFLHDLVQLPTLLEVIRKRKIRQYRDDSRVDEELVDPIVEPAPESMAEAIGEQIDPKKRGRKPKPKTVTEEQFPVGPGRPTLARNALETWFHLF